MRRYDNPVYGVSWPDRLCTTMRQCLLVIVASLLLLCNTLAAQAGEQHPQAPGAWATSVGGCEDGTTLVGKINRRPITGSVVEYSWQVRVGSGARDIIGMHRVVKELAPFVPHPTAKAVLMVHGDIWGFDAAFLASLASASIPDSQALPVFLAQNTEQEDWISFLQGTAPYEPVNIFAQGEALLCHDDLPFDDHLEDIMVPVLYVGAGGGFGEFGVYTTTLLGSTDVTIHLVDLRPDAQRVEDFGHADLFLADKAKDFAWKQIPTWIKSH